MLILLGLNKSFKLFLSIQISLQKVMGTLFYILWHVCAQTYIDTPRQRFGSLNMCFVLNSNIS